MQALGISNISGKSCAAGRRGCRGRGGGSPWPHLPGRGGGEQVKVLGLVAEQQVPDCAANHIALEACVHTAEEGRYRPNNFIFKARGTGMRAGQIISPAGLTFGMQPANGSPRAQRHVCGPDGVRIVLPHMLRG